MFASPFFLAFFRPLQAWRAALAMVLLSWALQAGAATQATAFYGHQFPQQVTVGEQSHRHRAQRGFDLYSSHRARD